LARKNIEVTMIRIACSGLALALVACQPLPTEPPPIEGFAACAAPAVDGWTEPFAKQHIDASGSVTSGGPGDPPSGCALEDPAMVVGDPAHDQAWWFDLADGETGDTFTVAFLIPGMAPPFAIGTSLHVLWDWQPPEFGTGQGSLELRSASDSTLFWAGVAPTVEDLAPPLSVLEAGRPVARNEGSCGTVESSELDVATGDEQRGVVGYGEVAIVGSNVVHHGGLDAQVAGDGCPDWAPDRAAVAIEYYFTGGGGGGGGGQ
jgi:hypothetical protein